MIPQSARLPSNIKLINALVLRFPHFSVRLKKNSLLINRYAFVVAKKIDKRAVARNRLRRKLREVFWENTQEKFSGIDMVVVVVKQFLDVSREEIVKEVQKAIAQIEAI